MIARRAAIRAQPALFQRRSQSGTTKEIPPQRLHGTGIATGALKR
jgi:hypothetical protein